MILLLKARPTPAQAEAGNYKKPRRHWNGLEIAIENPAGSVRQGEGWRTKMQNAYGYICRSEAVDGDEVDVYLGPELDSAPTVYVVHQRRAGDWKAYDEDKCMIGFGSEAAARAAYLVHYDDKRFLGPITAMPVDEFVAKVRATYYKPAMIKTLFMKTHVNGYTRADGTVVAPHEDSRTLYHGSPSRIEKIRDQGLFGGLFASGSRESAESHGDIVHKIDLPESAIMTQSQMEEISDEELKAAAHWVDDEDLERVRELVVDDERAEDDDARIMRADDAGEASWEAQRLRGVIAKKKGFKAVEMNDEHGTSYLVLPGSDIALADDEMSKSMIIFLPDVPLPS